MDIEHLREFVTVASYRSISRAADELHMSQPALSAHIAALEKRYGVALFSRERPLRLTPAGQRLVEDASAVLNAFAQMEEHISNMGASCNSLVIGYNDTHHAANLNAFAFIGAFMKQHPEVTIQWVSISAPTVSSALETANVDCVISCACPLDSDLKAGISYLQIPASTDDRLCLWVDETHPLATRQVLHWGDLDGIKMPHSEKSCLLWSSAALQLLHNHGLDVRNMLKGEDNISFLQALAPDEVQLFDASYQTFPVLALFPNRRLIPIDEPDARNVPFLAYGASGNPKALDLLISFIGQRA